MSALTHSHPFLLLSIRLQLQRQTCSGRNPERSCGALLMVLTRLGCVLCFQQKQAQQQQMYIAQVLQDPTSDEAGGGSSEEDRGSSQDEEMLNGGNSINEADFQSGEDSLIANEVHQ